MRSAPLIALAAFGASCGAAAQDQQRDWPRFHLGIAVGPSLLGHDMAEAGVPEQPWGNRSVDSDTGLKLVAGFRPVRVVGLEIQFIDFGEGAVEAHAGPLLGGGQVTYWEQSSSMTSSADGKVLAALLFIPEASPRIDIYAKVGVAHLDESLTAAATSYHPPECSPIISTVPPRVSYPSSCSFRSDVDKSGSEPYLGFGARFKVASAAGVRVEYEAVIRNGGDPTQLLSVGIAHEF